MKTYHSCVCACACVRARACGVFQTRAAWLKQKRTIRLCVRARAGCVCMCACVLVQVFAALQKFLRLVATREGSPAGEADSLFRRLQEEVRTPPHTRTRAPAIAYPPARDQGETRTHRVA